MIGITELLMIFLLPIAFYVLTLYLAYRYGKKSGKLEVKARLEEKLDESEDS